MKLSNALTKIVAAFLLGASVMGISLVSQVLVSDVILVAPVVLALTCVGLDSLIVMVLSIIFLTSDVEVEFTKE